MREVLSALSKELNEKHPHIHYGGCAKLSKIMMEEIAKLKIKVKTQAKVIGCRDTDDDTPINTFSKHILWDAVDFSHVVTKIGKYYFDNTQVSTTKYSFGREFGTMYNGSLDLETTRYICRIGRWNKKFDTSELPSIRRIVRKHLKKLS